MPKKITGEEKEKTEIFVSRKLMQCERRDRAIRKSNILYVGIGARNIASSRIRLDLCCNGTQKYI